MLTKNNIGPFLFSLAGTAFFAYAIIVCWLQNKMLLRYSSLPAPNFQSSDFWLKIIYSGACAIGFIFCLLFFLVIVQEMRLNSGNNHSEPRKRIK